MTLPGIAGTFDEPSLPYCSFGAQLMTAIAGYAFWPVKNRVTRIHGDCFGWTAVHAGAALRALILVGAEVGSVQVRGNDSLADTSWVEAAQVKRYFKIVQYRKSALDFNIIDTTGAKVSCDRRPDSRDSSRLDAGHMAHRQVDKHAVSGGEDITDEPGVSVRRAASLHSDNRVEDDKVRWTYQVNVENELTKVDSSRGGAVQTHLFASDQKAVAVLHRPGQRGAHMCLELR